MSLPVNDPAKRSQPFSKAAIFVFVLLLFFTLAVLYGCLKNVAYLSYPAFPQYGISLPFLWIVLLLNVSTLVTGLFFLARRKIARANLFLFAGNTLIYLFFFLVTL